jgi:hypothetical protein
MSTLRYVRDYDRQRGLLTNLSLRKVPGGAATTLTNFRPLPFGDLELRLGQKVYSASPSELAAVVGLARHYRKDGINQFWRGCMGFDEASDQLATPSWVHLVYGETGLQPLIDDLLWTVAYKDILYRGGEASAGMKWDGVNLVSSLVTRHGNPPPTPVPAGVDGGAGSIEAGTYFIRYTFEYGLEGELGESNPSPPSAAIVIGANRRLDAANIQSPNTATPPIYYFWSAAGGKKRVYRTIVSGTDVTAPYYLAGTITGAGTTITLSENNATVQGHQKLSFDNGLPPEGARYATLHKERLWLGWTTDIIGGTGSQVHPNRLHYSKLDASGTGIVDNFGALDFIEVERTANDEITGIIGQYSNLLASKVNSLWQVNGDPPILSRDPISRSIGCFAPRSLIEHRGAIFFMSRKGPYVFTGSSLEPLGDGLQPTWDALGDNLRSCVAFIDDDQVKFAVP